MLRNNKNYYAMRLESNIVHGIDVHSEIDHASINLERFIFSHVYVTLYVTMSVGPSVRP